ncbi:MAG: type II secretion system F family protein [Verrucomicrobia bacterium]|nr:type II secretion system F family protein [Verrucomicrobiota bacterium]
MPRYEVITQVRKNSPYTRTFAEASSLAELNARLSNLNKPVVQVIEPVSARVRISRTGVGLRSRLLFLQQLETCAYLGVDLRAALGMCLDSTSRKTRGDRRLLAVLKELRTHLSRGASFSRAAGAYPEVFDEVSVGLLSAGEEGGTFPESLTNVRRIWARNEELRHRLGTMLVYPLVVLGAAVGVVWLLITRVVPQFVAVLSEMRVNLPWPTRLLVAVSQFVRDYPWLVGAAALLFIIGCTRLPILVRKQPRLHGLILRLPVLGKLNLLLLRANFCRTFAQLKTARAKTTHALLLCRDLSWNFEYRAAVARALVRVQRGEGLSQALADEAEMFGDMIANGINFMEISGAGSEGLNRLTELLERELDGQINVMRQVLDPLLILFLGLVIGGIVFATFLPAIQILQNI